MTFLVPILVAFVAVACAFHVASIAIAAMRSRSSGSARLLLPREAPGHAEGERPLVTILRPVFGSENHLEATLRSTFAVVYPHLEIIFCATAPDDPAAVLVRRLIAEHPAANATLLIGNDSVSANPKLNNVVKGWRAAHSEWIVMADSNVLMPSDYVERLLSAWKADTAAVCSPPVGCRPEGFWAELECAFLNTYAARWQWAASFVGQGFAQGKTMLMRRSLIEGWGGIRALGEEPAEDAALTKLVHAAGLRIRLADTLFAQPLGYRSAREVWSRQVRWARLRRASFPIHFALEALTGFAPPVVATTVAVAVSGAPLSVVPALAVAWYGAEAALARIAGWHLSLLSPFGWMLRDLLLPLIWVSGWAGDRFVWRGHAMQAAES